MRNQRNILFFDGHCNLCNGLVDFVISQDKKRQIFVASLQGETARTLLPEDLLNDLNTVVFLTDKGERLIKSQAIFRVFRLLGFPYRSINVFSILPVGLCNFFYDLIARNRYRIFGRQDTCRLPTDDEKGQFLD